MKVPVKRNCLCKCADEYADYKADMVNIVKMIVFAGECTEDDRFFTIKFLAQKQVNRTLLNKEPNVKVSDTTGAK